MSVLAPPYFELSWPATALGTGFKAYRVWRRRSRLPVEPWRLIAEEAVGFGYTPATVEAQHTKFRDFEVGWNAGPGSAWEWGADYTVTVVQALTGAETIVGQLVAMRQALTADDESWLTSNAAPYLCTPAETLTDIDTSVTDTILEFATIGGDGAVTRTPLEVPPRVVQLKHKYLGDTGEELWGPMRAAAISGRRMSLLTPRGDVVRGTVRKLGSGQAATLSSLDASCEIVETGGRQSEVAEYNLPCGIVLNGTTQFVTTPDAADLDFGTGDFAVIIAGVFPATSGAVHISKGNGGAATSWAVRNTSGTQVSFSINGVNVITANHAVLTDGNYHVLIVEATAGQQVMYLDGEQIGATGNNVYTTVNNAVALVAGANNGGASGFSAMNPLQSWGVYPRRLGATDAKRASHYLRGYAGGKLPGGAVAFWDARNQDCWYGVGPTLKDIAGFGHLGTLTASPVTRGYPWELSLLDRAA